MFMIRQLAYVLGISVALLVSMEPVGVAAQDTEKAAADKAAADKVAAEKAAADKKLKDLEAELAKIKKDKQDEDAARKAVEEGRKKLEEAERKLSDVKKQKTEAKIVEWGTIGEVKPFVTRQLTELQLAARKSSYLECQVVCGCAHGHHVCRLQPVEVLHTETYLETTRRTFVYGPPIECWIAKFVPRKVDSAAPAGQAPAVDRESVQLLYPLRYFDVQATEDKSGSTFRLQASVRDPGVRIDKSVSALSPIDGITTIEDLHRYSWSSSKITMPDNDAKLGLVLIWNVHNDTTVTKAKEVSFTFEGVDAFYQPRLASGAINCNQLDLIKDSVAATSPVALKVPALKSSTGQAILSLASRIYFVPKAADPMKPTDPKALTYSINVKVDGVDRDFSFDQINDHFKINREFQSIRTYSRDLP